MYGVIQDDEERRMIELMRSRFPAPSACVSAVTVLWPTVARTCPGPERPWSAASLPSSVNRRKVLIDWSA